METISDYTIHCTPEQTKKALELGASIELESEYYHPTEHDFKLDNPIPCESFTNGYHYAKCPTAEQMLGWLEEQDIFINVNNTCEGYSSWVKLISNRYHITENVRYVSSRKEAILAGIDTALEYLINSKKNESTC